MGCKACAQKRYQRMKYAEYRKNRKVNTPTQATEKSAPVKAEKSVEQTEKEIKAKEHNKAKKLAHAQVVKKQKEVAEKRAQDLKTPEQIKEEAEILKAKKIKAVKEAEKRAKIIRSRNVDKAKSKSRLINLSQAKAKAKAKAKGKAKGKSKAKK